ncbi:uncharacterized protein LOC108911826 isoform X2 [Anoplophora glabripennis]|uniref:uncharacterized protein LOC108911826 isoform X2 n=1 Tax=Anoplophora glabripennis TaxID=217634 RepID=UPI0008748C1A|nr:uncharacterized protein LOC108911826 isoform X2 [Anoplophora glabripennis]
MDKTSWTIVKFDQEDSVEAVPSTWIVGNSCYWPPTTNQERITSAIRRHDIPSTCWPQHKISLLKNAVFDNYTEARQKTKIAEYSSDLNEEISSRKIRCRKGQSSSETSSEDEIQTIPEPPDVRSNIDNRMRSNTDNHMQSNTDNHIRSNTNNQISCICCPLHKKDILGQKDIVSMLENMNSLVRKFNLLLNITTDTLDELKNVKKHLNNTSKDDETESVLNKFNVPITSIEDFYKLEEFLEVEDNFKKSVYEFSKIGGSNTYDFIRRVLSVIITNNLAQNFTWFGTKEKKAFQKLKISEVIIEAAGKCDIGDRKLVEEAVKKYLRRAKERAVFENKKYTT